MAENLEVLAVLVFELFQGLRVLLRQKISFEKIAFENRVTYFFKDNVFRVVFLKVLLEETHFCIINKFFIIIHEKLITISPNASPIVTFLLVC